MELLSSATSQAVQSYFSHSYRADDRSVNLFFWELFSAEGFFFTVDPQSGKFIAPYLERMMRYSDCFIAVVTRRLETIRKIGEVTLPKPQAVWTYSPYIAFENYLAELAGKPRLVYVESGLDANLFGSHDHVHIFERTTLDKRKKQFRDEVHDFATRVRSYTGYSEHILKPTGKAGILIDTSRANDSYPEQTISDIQQAVHAGGYSAEVISPHFTTTQSFIRRLQDLELIVAEIRAPYVTAEALAFIQAKALPCIRIAKLGPNESKTQLVLPDLLKDYQVGDIEPAITWKKRMI